MFLLKVLAIQFSRIPYDVFSKLVIMIWDWHQSKVWMGFRLILSITLANCPGTKSRDVVLHL